MKTEQQFDNNRRNRKLFIVTLIVLSTLLTSVYVLLNNLDSVYGLVAEQTADIGDVTSQIEQLNTMFEDMATS